MEKFLTPETFEFFARYVLAGFILISVRSRFVVGERPRPAEVIVEAVVLSLINQLVFLAARTPLSHGFQLLGWPFEGQALLLLEVLVLPVCLGLLAGWNLSRGWSHALLRRLAMPIEHPVRRAYDYAFATNRPPGFVILTFQDGTQVFGYFGQESLAANDADRSDIYLERLYNIDDEGQWSEHDVSRSAIISLQGIRSIEFLEPEGDRNV
ncbi:DUF6338 family protein [Roseovarius atlanticus]|uniref:DUF6338 family protein n=1 Tax=Roseovarius atlanticus TaxID=1641875 RepID=UPI001C944BDF|nr:DUF6338 family protein [Roseovarius atlanticus]MBY5990237.1 hypothetical protein [Roseovarius atlanticus]MBY6126783.1 hypothetical protein [Roseovarius atlanticus]MBY6151276.1 hypothetical protein [Roseovarius atlanticus]